MDRKLIYADALDEILKDLESRYKKWLFYISAKAVANVRKIVYAMKTVEVKHGHWIVGADGSYMCSECGKVFRYEIGNYCAHCGAKLDGDGDE